MTGCSAARLLAYGAGAVLHLNGDAIAQDPAMDGQWSIKYDWSDQIDDPTTNDDPDQEIAHGALLSQGLYSGHVLLWNYWDAQNTTRAWLFDPQQPDDLIEIGAALPSNIFCAGHSFTRRRGLAIVGGFPFGHPDQNRKTYLFNPLTLQPTVPSGTPPFLIAPGTPSTWIETAEMSDPHYYPSVVQLRDETIVEPSGWSTAAESMLVLGGPPGTDTVSGGSGTRWWEIREPGATAWDRLHDTDPTALNYELHPPLDSPDADLDSYPRALQLSDGFIYLAGDVDTINQNPSNPSHVPPNPFNAAWAVEPSNSSEAWKLWKGNPMATGRHYGSAVLLHTQVENDRILVFGGGETDLVADDYDPSNSVQELEQGASATRPWISKAPMLAERMFLNAVVLPTREIFINGGTGGTTTAPPDSLTPELYDPGGQSFLFGASRLVATPPLYPDPSPQQAPDKPTPRLYHHIAILLEDARVLVMGGDQREVGGVVLDPLSQFTAEIYSPPYLFRGERPTIEFAPNSVKFSDGALVRTLTVAVSLPITDTLERIVLLRPGSVTHHFDADQRYIELAHTVVSFGQTGPPTHVSLELEVTAPDWDLGPAGMYMLFAVSSKPGTEPVMNRLVPSVAHFVDLNR